MVTDLGNDQDTIRPVIGDIAKINVFGVAYQNYVRWLHNLLTELNVPVDVASVVRYDNEATISVMTRSSGHHERYVWI
ncbi:hypothetical protein GN244_ATG17803 [Phytophthora infestans]|uniref:Uncharacterized protein n=1 Tax=Phytophthora infestans TaxID=4787 RepID=A0A833S8E3_PHYIN|nr:hypothetical protein GN244_ATG17803 [Phytophthora infestans]